MIESPITVCTPHAPVLLSEVIELMAPKPGDFLIDATFGAGGYSEAFLSRGARVLGLDRDPTVAPFAEKLKSRYPGQLDWLCLPFSSLEEGLARINLDRNLEKCQGVVFDLGVSSMQLDQSERGFSFMRDGPLDMRMGNQGTSAADLVNQADVKDLAAIFRNYGEERFSRRIAQHLVACRQIKPFERTLELADAIASLLGGRKNAPIHPATRAFQGLRIAVNDELREIELALEASARVLTPGGRLAVVTFHSLEDRIVKTFLREKSGQIPKASRHHLAMDQDLTSPCFHNLFKKPKLPSPEEMARNPRARSAKLRAAVYQVKS